MGKAAGILVLVAAASILFGAAGCGNAPANIAIGVVGGTLLGAQSPGQEIQQIYYLGVFDPQGQVPSTIYRVRVHGQASAISRMRFGSGWVPAQLIDSLTTRAEINESTSRPSISIGDSESEKGQLASLKTGRRLMMFGPEGFREAPKDHRLVIVMGTTPEKFFQAIDSSLEAVTEVRQEQANTEVSKKIFAAMGQLRAERIRLDELNKDVAADLPASGQAASAGGG